MNLPQRKPPGPVKRYTRYFTTPLTDALLQAFEQIKWRTHLDKTEVARRLFEYFSTLPPDAQDKILKSFDQLREKEDKEIAVKRGRVKKKVESPTFKKPEPVETKPPLAPVRVIKRSGLP